jgi:hypothetical protein
MRDGAHRTACFLAAVSALLGTAAIAGTWLLDDRDVIVLTGASVVTAVLARWCRGDRRAEERARIAVTQAHEREAALIAAIERLSGVTQTGPMAVLRRVS